MSFLHKFFEDDVRSSLKWVTLGGALFGIAYLGSRLIKTITSTQNTPNLTPQISQIKPQTQRMNTKMSDYSEYYFDKDQELQLIQSTISQTPSVEEIYLNSPTIVKDEFLKYTREMRKRRRLIRKVNEDQYINTVLIYHEEIYQLLIRSRMELIQYLQMDAESFSHLEEEYETFSDLASLSEKSMGLLKDKLNSETKVKKMSVEKLKLIVQEQLLFMKNKMYIRIRQKLQKEVNVRQDQILIVVENLLEDIVYEKFGYEQEDIVRKIAEIGFNEKQLEEARRKMRSEIAEFNFDSLDSLENEDDDLDEGGMKKSAMTLQESQSNS